MINDQLFIHIKNQRNLSPLKRYYPKDVDQICYLIYFMVLSHEIKVSQIAGEIRRHLIAYGFKECQSNYDRKTTGHGGYTIYPPIPSKQNQYMIVLSVGNKELNTLTESQYARNAIGD